MKTITLDWETYTQEIEDAKKLGEVKGLSYAADYIRNPKCYWVKGDRFESSREDIDEALASLYVKKEKIDAETYH